MASFQAKIGWKWQRKRENKNYHSVWFLPDAWKKLQKNCKKIQKIETFCYGFFSNQNRLEKAETEKK